MLRILFVLVVKYLTVIAIKQLKILLRLIISDHMPWFGDKQKQTQNYNKPSTYLWNGDTKRQDLGKFK